MINRLILGYVLALFMAVSPAFAVNPDEILDNPKLEQRARDISANLRCMVCQNQSIDDSDADLAADLRVLVRERLVSGDSDAEVMEYVVGRYGEFVLLRPAFSARNILLWGAPIFVLLLGAAAALAYSRRQYSSNANNAASLSHEEEERLSKLLDDTDDK